MKEKSSLLTLLLILYTMYSVSQETGSFTDYRDGKTYKTVTIGTQTWMAENLAYKADSGCWKYDDAVSNIAIYGYLYNWETSQNVCPSAWHLPSLSEWQSLLDTLGGKNEAGLKMMETGTLHWSDPNTDATNESGFTGLPGGYRDIWGAYMGLGDSGNWWTSFNEDEYGAFYWYLFSYGSIDKDFYGKPVGLSVRCVKDK